MLNPKAEYRDLGTLVRWLKVTLLVFTILALLGIWSGSLEISLLEEMRSGYEATESEVEASDSRQALVGMLQFLAFLSTAILFGRWIFLSNQNARALGAKNMEFSPGWSVGWYFVPVLNLWRPYQAMKEIFRVSHLGFGNEQVDRILAPVTSDIKIPGVVRSWWALWVVSNVLGHASLRGVRKPWKLLLALHT